MGCSIPFYLNFYQVDTREPHVMRIAPTPLYNSFADVHRFVTALGEAFDVLEQSESGP